MQAIYADNEEDDVDGRMVGWWYKKELNWDIVD